VTLFLLVAVVLLAPGFEFNVDLRPTIGVRAGRG